MSRREIAICLVGGFAGGFVACRLYVVPLARNYFAIHPIETAPYDQASAITRSITKLKEANRGRQGKTV